MIVSKIEDNTPVYLTKKGVEQIKGKLIYLKKTLPALAAEAGRTAAYGDRSDNDAYKEAKRVLRRTKSQILFIERQLKRVRIILTKPNISGEVQLGSTVVLELRDKSQKTFQILDSVESYPEKGRISYKSPLGAALIQHKKGDVVTIELPRGTEEYLILKVQ